MHHAQLRAFHAVAASGGFTAAATKLGVGQPTLSIQVRALETYFGVELFHRSGRKVAVSELGSALFGLTQRLFAAEAEAIDLLSAVRDLRHGHLHIGADGPYHVTEILAAFTARFPQIRVSVAIGNSQELEGRLLDFRSDVAVLAPLAADPRFHALPYARHRIVAMVHRDHPWAGRSAIALPEFAGQRMVLRESGSTTRHAFEQALAASGIAVDIALEIATREAVWHAVARNIGLGIVSEPEIIPHPDIRILPISGADLHTDEQIVCLAERRDSRLVAAFLEIARELAAASRNPADLTNGLLERGAS
jgi:aminoethylphosphonate catabolism LysR family transcriptional regulator